VDKEQLDSVASILTQSYLDTLSFSRQFKDEYDQPPTLVTKVHHMRSVAQAMVNRNGRFRLGETFVDFGRVQFFDTDTKTDYLLRSDGMVAIEEAKRQGALFDPVQYLKSSVVLLVYRFHRDGLDLSVAGTLRRTGRLRFVASGPPTFIGTWPFSSTDGDTPFDQGFIDPFGDIGDIDEEGETDEGKGE
jgi:hypothetical protein